MFSGCGGLDYGLEAAGFSTRLCVEVDVDCRESLERNRPEWLLANPGDVTQISPTQILRQAGLRKRELDLLAGGPPCQPFSKAGFWRVGSTRRMLDPRADCLSRYFAVLEAALPKVMLIENVAGIAYEGMDEGWKYCQAALRAINKRNNTRYDPVLLNINAADYGVPQIRKRVFIIAERSGSHFTIPGPSHAPRHQADLGNLTAYLTAWDAIGDVNDDDENLRLSGRWAELLPSIPEGDNYLWHTDRGGGKALFGWRTRYWSFLLKLAKDKPAWTLSANPGPSAGPFHWRNRRLSVQEMSALQTFPTGVTIAGSYRSALRQVGNAVPSAIAELLGLEIRRQFYGKRVRRSLTLLPVVRTGMPEPSSVRAFPECFIDRVGSHAVHPGTGKGPGVRGIAPQVVRNSL